MSQLRSPTVDTIEYIYDYVHCFVFARDVISKQGAFEYVQ